jgi:hypothetical protein
MRDQLVKRGYQVLEYLTDERGYFKQISARKEAKNQYFVIEREKETIGETYLCYVKMVGPSNIETKFIMRDKDPTLFYSVRNSGIADNYTIDGIDPDQIDDFINNNRVFPLFANLIQTSIDHKVEVSSKNRRCLIRIRSDCDFTKALAALPFLESIIEMFQLKDSLQHLITGVGAYICHKCQREMSLDGKKCQNCGAVAPICVICFRDLEPGEKVGVTDCCGSNLHLRELEAWLKIKSSCPYCSSADPTVKVIEDEE